MCTVWLISGECDCFIARNEKKKQEIEWKIIHEHICPAKWMEMTVENSTGQIPRAMRTTNITYNDFTLTFLCPI